LKKGYHSENLQACCGREDGGQYQRREEEGTAERGEVELTTVDRVRRGTMGVPLEEDEDSDTAIGISASEEERVLVESGRRGLE
jgi:hypothetical protein